MTISAYSVPWVVLDLVAALLVGLLVYWRGKRAVKLGFCSRPITPIRRDPY